MEANICGGLEIIAGGVAAVAGMTGGNNTNSC